jgi:hypothetical protein
LHFGTWSFYFFIFGLYNFKFVHFNHWIFIKSNLGVWWWNPTLKSNLYDINIIPFKIYFQFYVSGYKLRELSLPFLFNQKKNIFQCSELGLVILLLTHQAAKIDISNLFFFFFVCSKLQLYTYIGLRFKKHSCNYYYYYYYYYFLSSQ